MSTPCSSAGERRQNKEREERRNTGWGTLHSSTHPSTCFWIPWLEFITGLAPVNCPQPLRASPSSPGKKRWRPCLSGQHDKPVSTLGSDALTSGSFWNSSSVPSGYTLISKVLQGLRVQTTANAVSPASVSEDLLGEKGASPGSFSLCFSSSQ